MVDFGYPLSDTRHRTDERYYDHAYLQDHNLRDRDDIQNRGDNPYAHPNPI